MGKKKYINSNFFDALLDNENGEIVIDGRWSEQEAVDKMNFELESMNVVPIKVEDLHKGFALMAKYDAEWNDGSLDEDELSSYCFKEKCNSKKAIPIWRANIVIKDTTKNIYGYVKK